MLTLYNSLLLPVRLGVETMALWRGRGDGRLEWQQRLARSLPDGIPGGFWLHGASVGEARIVTSLVEALHERAPDRPVAVSCVTRTGREQLPSPPTVRTAFFAPLDFAGLAGRVLHALDPSVLTLIETELWPNWLHEAAAHGVPAVVVNGRLSPERMSRYRRFSGLYRPLLERMARVGAQSESDAERFVAIGLPEDRIEVTGNVKYDLPMPEGNDRELRGHYHLPVGRRVIVAGSTGVGEDEQVLDAFARVRGAHPETWLILAPRHPERCDDVARLVEQRGFSVGRWTREAPEQLSRRDVLLVDTVGQLSGLYHLATVAFVGGSLVPVGGHNVLEPAAMGVPVLFGPHTGHVEEPAAALISAGGAERVADSTALANALESLLGDEAHRVDMGRRARGVLDGNRGAMGRSADLVCRVADAAGAASQRH